MGWAQGFRSPGPTLFGGGPVCRLFIAALIYRGTEMAEKSIRSYILRDATKRKINTLLPTAAPSNVAFSFFFRVFPFSPGSYTVVRQVRPPPPVSRKKERSISSQPARRSAENLHSYSRKISALNSEAL